MLPWIIIGICASIVSAIPPKVIDLSNRGMKKEEFFTKIQKQINLAEVTDLNLRGNEFDTFLDCSTYLENLKTLDLSQNHLQRFFFLCKDEYNLQQLNISHNKLEYIDENGFNNRIPKLTILDVSWNKLSVVNETMLQHFKVLEYLSLANNPINEGIHENAFWNLVALRYLNLSNISASYFSSEMFKTLSNLSNLDLSSNPISVVPLLPANLEELDISDTHVCRLQGVYLPRLRELKMNNMRQLRQLILNDLENFTSLETLTLDGSKNLAYLTKWRPYETILLPRLQRLSMANCALKTIEYNLASIIPRVPILNLENNPWNCDCKMKWLHASNETRIIARQIKCRTPEQHAGKELSEVPSYYLACQEDSSSVLRPVLWASILTLLLAIMLVSIFFLLRGPLSHWDWDIRRKNHDTVSYTNVDETSNDLVKILALGEGGERNDE
ncbi:leucine-rich repeat neuronal protein 1-like [Ceratina calcarata]|uniref:Leucine-rich repeat neuronal protein 1-like n=1 Tax=Ceratina calcarata TaxID=156304 RepID=A0AAJ7J509_9HYME|nr:leucine-rich repeat neuronal protein 1-like [Ceratina calcarata]